MQAFVPRSYLTPVRDDEAESQRKAKSRHARQTRRSTQGVTLTDLKEAQKTYSLSHQDREKEERGTLEDRSCLRRDSVDDRGDQTGLTETTVIGLKWSKMDEEGNMEHRLETLAESPNLTYLSVHGSCSVPYNNNSSFRVAERWWRDENQNPIDGEAELTFSANQQQRRVFYNAEDTEHERLSRYDSSGESATEKALGRTSSYTRRETRLAALNRQEQDSTAKDYKKMYAEALQENERLKFRLQDSKQELVKIRSQLEKVTQRQDRISERSTVLESEKREKQALEKKVSDMEEELKVLTELKSDNQRLKDENGALIRVISKLSK
ncbi:protein phosphatase 1 regulatory subunit 12B isoform X2 [Melanotaenia boesemani]|uniref:protein phosphatase 1 regulatory subunit 12B isoform X2 n=1 Tax=Melanotaenia boesemani TaxID=1250792 RepID=UPI001C04DD7E|nr:protein phosphatase 1 regulatory subunit 12B isoform X2 [Melanotaenia boesemani]